MRVCLLTYDDRDPDYPDYPHVPADPRPFLPDADWKKVELEKETAVSTVVQLARDGFDLFFNLCDGGWDSEAPGIEVVHALERLEVPFTGADSHFYDPSREAMKRVAAAYGIATPRYVLATTSADLERAAETLSLPLIVKPDAGYSSIGITPASRVETAADLRRQAGETIRTRGAALIEEFIEGGEATVLVSEDPDDPTRPVAYTPIAYRFPPGESFKHYDLKWHDYHGLQTAPVDDPALDRTLKDSATTLFAGLGGVGYGRCDFRIDASGRPVLLEINPNCGIYYPDTDPGSADLCLLADPAGHAGFTDRIVRAAFARHRERRRGWTVRPTETGFAVFATRSFQPGETVIRYEEERHTLVTRSRVEAAWGPTERDWFLRYAWPLTDEVWVIWDRDPENWRPVNHSCEPTAWLSGLDVEARIAVEPGDEITLDYATFYNEVMPDFECDCGSGGCRGTIRGSDLLRPFVDRYGPHVSDYVRRRRADRRPRD
jgi:D-alanine-D-alanine ligase-like ATP-grasp enzyme